MQSQLDRLGPEFRKPMTAARPLIRTWCYCKPEHSWDQRKSELWESGLMRHNCVQIGTL
jgi:hypothetical protein